MTSLNTSSIDNGLAALPAQSFLQEEMPYNVPGVQPWNAVKGTFIVERADITAKMLKKQNTSRNVSCLS